MIQFDQVSAEKNVVVTLVSLQKVPAVVLCSWRDLS